MRVAVLYASYSGNTEEVAELIYDASVKKSAETKIIEITEISEVVDLDQFDLIFFGTFTWDRGGTPDFVKDFIADVGYKPDNIAVFGTGDTQFGGDEIYCGAVKKLHRFYNSKWTPLMIEQSPRGSQERKVTEWAYNVIESRKE